MNVLLVHAQNTAGIEMAICGLSSMASPGFVLLSRGVIQHVVVHRSSIFAEEGRWSFVILCHHYVSFWLRGDRNVRLYCRSPRLGLSVRN